MARKVKQYVAPAEPTLPEKDKRPSWYGYEALRPNQDLDKHVWYKAGDGISLRSPLPR